MKTKVFLTTLALMAMMVPAHATPTEKPFEEGAIKRIVTETDNMRQDNGNGYNVKKETDKKDFDNRTDKTAAEISDTIMQEEGKKYNDNL